MTLLLGNLEFATCDPFASSTDPAVYVPRTATEAALLALEDALRGGAGLLSLHGAEGSGRTLLLRVLGERLGESFRPLHLPYPRLSPAELWQWVAARLGESAGGDAAARLRERLARDADAGAAPLLLLVDDAHSVPPETLVELEAQRRLASGVLRVVLVLPQGVPEEMPRALRAVLRQIHLAGAMSAEETHHYVRERLARCDADPRTRERIEAVLPALVEGSLGNPARLAALASEALHPLRRSS